MYKFAVGSLIFVCCLGVIQSYATLVTVTIPDPSPLPYISFGSGNASVTYSGVVFAQSALLSDGVFFNIGPLWSGFPAVLSSQEQTVGVANILITLPSATTFFSLNYGTFNGSSVSFALSNGYSTTLASTGGNGYDVPDVFSITSSPFTTVLVTSPDFVLDINNSAYGTLGTTTPEPNTLVLLTSGLLALGGGFRRRR